MKIEQIRDTLQRQLDATDDVRTAMAYEHCVDLINEYMQEEVTYVVDRYETKAFNRDPTICVTTSLRQHENSRLNTIYDCEGYTMVILEVPR